MPKSLRSFMTLLAAIVLLLTPGFLCGCRCGQGVGVRSMFYGQANPPEVVATQWGVIQPVAPQIVAVPAPTGVTYAAPGCIPGVGSTTTVPLGGTYTPGWTYAAPPGR